MTTDVEILREHHPDLYEELLREVVWCGQVNQRIEVEKSYPTQCNNIHQLEH